MRIYSVSMDIPPPPCTILARHEMTIVPERVINIDWGWGGGGGGGGEVGLGGGHRIFFSFLALARSS